MLVGVGVVVETTWITLRDGGLFARPFTVQPGTDIKTALEGLGVDGNWADEGATLPGGEYSLMDALDHGEEPERRPLDVDLRAGDYRVFSGRTTHNGVDWVLLRLALS